MNMLRTIACVAFVLAAWSAHAQEKLTIWWAKGFYQAEDESFRNVVAAFEQQTGIKVELSLFNAEDAVIKATSAVTAGEPPDIAFAHTFDFRTTNLWAFNGQLDDVSDVVEGIKDRLFPVAYRAVHLFNGKTSRTGIYAVPIEQSTMHIFYWRDLLQEGGFGEADIPTDWHGYWDFWCDKVQAGLRKKGRRIYGIGLPLSTAGSDTFDSFMLFLAAYNVQLVDDQGRLVINEPANRKGLASALKDYVDIYQKGCTPPSSVGWVNADNNNAFNNRTVAMTPNATLSIPGKFLDDKNMDAYQDKIRTAGFPHGPDGKPIAYNSAVKTAVVFANASNKAAAHKFLSFLMQPANIDKYVDGSLGRWFPATRDGAARDFWMSGEDSHRRVAFAQYQGEMRPFPFVINFKIMRANAEGLWGRVMNRMIQDKISSDAAAEEIVARLNQHFAD